MTNEESLKRENEALGLKLKKLEALKKREEYQAEQRRRFPWRHMFKNYSWQKEFFACTEPRQIVVSANQVSKSTSAITKLLEWGTNRSLWSVLFPDSFNVLGHPRAFWYLYPSLKIATSEFEEKWRPLMPPKDDPENGWEVKYRGRDVDYIHFKNGVIVRFKTYMQDVHSLQGSSVDLLICDEEVPVEVLPELQMRVQATNGYMIFVFTATRGQTFWRRVVEDRKEWTDAAIWQVSLMDCQHYADGTPSQWTTRRIQRAIDSCVSEAQVQRRIMGRFVRDEGLMYEMWDRKKNMQEYEVLGPEWNYYMGVDYGSGGPKGHPSAITITAVNTKFTKAKVVAAWRGDGVSTTAEDVVNKVQEMKNMIDEDKLISIKYDYSAADIGTIAQRRGIGKVQRADKSRDAGIATLQSLIKNQAFQVCTHNKAAQSQGIDEHHCQTYKLMEEIENLGVDDKKQVAEDDLVDTVRYSLIGIPFDWEAIGVVKVKLVEKKKTAEDMRREHRGGMVESILGDMDGIEEEIGFWNEIMD